ncbi:MAG TPA: hypothetical protein VGP80_16670 [Gemmatimonadales bacterium]|nr:hypothetical protein [Gemmatimonadales bacterium]
MRYALLFLAIVGVAPAAHAQGSIFGVRSLGIPGRGVSAYSWALGGSTGLFDYESTDNPASIASTRTLSVGFQLIPERRSVETPAGSDKIKTVQFPLFSVAGPLRGSRVGLGLSFSNYTSRDFQVVSKHSEIIRGVPVDVTDSLTSRGGLNDIALSASYSLTPTVDVGIAAHVITGVNRLDQTRVFSDTSYLAAKQNAELSYAGYGLGIGAVFRLAPTLRLATVLRSDSKVDVDRDSSRSSSVDLPYTVGAAVQLSASRSLNLTGQMMYRTWSSANDDLVAEGAPGAKSTLELNGGAEWVGDPKRPWRRPIRLGVRYAQLPFLLEGVSDQPHELGISIGSGVRFAGQRGGLDVALERTWRSAGSDHKEKAWLLVIGLSVRPALTQQ